MTEYKITISVKNRKILKLMESKGIKTITELTKQMNELFGDKYPPTNNGINHTISRLINFRISPYHRKTNRFKPVVEDLSLFFGVMPEEILTEKQLNDFWTTKRLEFNADYEQLVVINKKTSLDFTDKELIEETMNHLKPREKKVLELLYYKDLTLEKVAEVTPNEKTLTNSVGIERIRYIASSALRKIRSPSTLGIKKEALIQTYIESD